MNAHFYQAHRTLHYVPQITLCREDAKQYMNKQRCVRWSGEAFTKIFDRTKKLRETKVIKNQIKDSDRRTSPYKIYVQKAEQRKNEFEQ